MADTAREIAGSAAVSHPDGTNACAAERDPGGGTRDPWVPGVRPRRSHASSPAYDRRPEPTGIRSRDDAVRRLAEGRRDAKEGGAEEARGRRVREAEERRAAKNGAALRLTPRPRWGARWRRIRTPRTVSFLDPDPSRPRGNGPGRRTKNDRAPRRARTRRRAACGAGAGRRSSPGPSPRSSARPPRTRSRTRRARGWRPTRARRSARGAAAMSSAAAAAAAAAAHHHQAAAASNAFAYESAYRRAGRARGPRCSGGRRHRDPGWTTGRGAATVATGTRIRGAERASAGVRPAGPPGGGGAPPIGRGSVSLASAAGCGPPRGPRRRRERRRSRRVPRPRRTRARARREARRLPGEPRRPCGRGSARGRLTSARPLVLTAKSSRGECTGF